MTVIKEITWVFKVDKAVEVVMTEALAKCTKQFARIVKKNVKSHSSQERTVRFIVRTVFQSIKMAAVNFQYFLQVNQKPVRLILAGFFLFLFIITGTSFAQEPSDSNDTIGKMKTGLDLQEDQVTNITPIIEKYSIAFHDLGQSIDAGTINPSAIDSQRHGLEAQETQELAQYLKPNQLSQWREMQGQMFQQKDSDDDEANATEDADRYTNMPNR